MRKANRHNGIRKAKTQPVLLSRTAASPFAFYFRTSTSYWCHPMACVCPYLFDRIALSKPWAGRRLPELFPAIAADFPPGTGESIELADLPGASPQVRSGAARGKTLHQLLAEQRPAILGPQGGSLQDFPLALKFIDTAQPLSIQVHPQDTFGAAGRLASRGKTEGWLILDAAPGATIYQGLKPGLRREHFERALKAGMPQETMNAREVRRGDWLLNPAGMVHALGGGLTLLEIQQNCGITLRFFDWPELGRQARELQVEQAFQACDFTLMPAEAVRASHDEGLQTLQAPQLARFCGEQDSCDGDARCIGSPFGVQSLRLSKAARHVKDWPGFTIFTCIEGGCELIVHGAGEIHTNELRPADTLLVPALFNDFEVYPRQSVWLVESYST